MFVHRLTARALLSGMSDEELAVQVSAADFEKARQGIVPSVSEEDVQHYEQLREQFSA